MHVPIDSTDAREQRELEQARAEAEGLENIRHSLTCRGGWLGEDEEGRPRPCPRCRPALMHVACHLCGVSHQACALQQAHRRGPCCPSCNHSRRTHEKATT
jgi:hypothetical protein